MKHLDFSKKQSNLLYINKPEIPCSIGIAAKNCNTVNYIENLHKIRKYERYLIHFETGISPNKIFFLNQQHEDRIVIADTTCNPTELFFAEADAIITSHKEFCLVIRTADCVPIMIFDPIQNCIAAIHSGWRSTEKNITGQTIKKMHTKFGSNPSDLIFFLLPAISGESYEVSEDVAVKFKDHYKISNNKFYLDLKSIIKTQIITENGLEDNIFNSFEDTFNFNDKYFSHRKGDIGRNLNYIILK